jgi:hypothetical protein
VRGGPLVPALALLSCLLLAGCAARDHAAASAADAAAPTAAVPTDPDGLRELLTRADLETAPLDAGSFILKDDRVQMVVFVEDGGASLQAVLPYRGPRRADPRDLATWNATRRFGRAYADTRGAPVLATDLALGEGVAPAAVVAWARLALALGRRFQEEAWPAAGPPPEPIGE